MAPNSTTKASDISPYGHIVAVVDALIRSRAKPVSERKRQRLVSVLLRAAALFQMWANPEKADDRAASAGPSQREFQNWAMLRHLGYDEHEAEKIDPGLTSRLMAAVQPLQRGRPSDQPLHDYLRAIDLVYKQVTGRQLGLTQTSGSGLKFAKECILPLRHYKDGTIRDAIRAARKKAVRTN